MSLGRTGTMWLIQPHLPPLFYVRKHTLTVKATQTQSNHAQLCLLACVLWAQPAIDSLFSWLRWNNHKTRLPLISISVKYVQHSYTAHTVHFPLCYFIDRGYNYPLFWSTALSEFPLCWTISTEGWLSHAIPQPEGTAHTLIIISNSR